MSTTFKIGDTIVPQSAPFVHALKSRFKGEACEWCFARERYDWCDLQRCGKCRLQFYCSKECQIKDWESGHKFECRYFRKCDFDFDDLSEGTQTQPEWSRIMFRTVVKLKARPELKDAPITLYNGASASFADLKYIPNRSRTMVKPRNIPVMVKAEIFGSWFRKAFREECCGLEELWDITSKLEANCLHISNPNGIFPMGVGLYLDIFPMERVPFGQYSNSNASIRFVGNEIQVIAGKEIGHEDKVVVTAGDIGEMFSGGNSVSFE